MGSQSNSLRQEDLDVFDARLIRALQEEGRAGVQHLASLLGVSRDVVSQRMRHLLTHEGLRVVAVLDPGFAGHRVLTHLAIATDGPVRPVALRLCELPEAVFVSMSSGVFPLLVELRHGSVEELHKTLDRIRDLPAVRRLRVTTYTKVIKGFFVAPKQSALTLDQVDYELIALLQHDGRRSYSSLSETVHLSPSSTRARVTRLIKGGVIRISAIKAGGISRNRLALGVGVTARGDTATIRQFLSENPSIEFAAQTYGNYDFVATLVGASSTAILESIERLRGLPDVWTVETWTHYDIVKEDYVRLATLRGHSA